MTPIEVLLSRKLKEAEPTLDILGADRKVLQVACQDFASYLKFLSSASDKKTLSLEVKLVGRFSKKPSAEVGAFVTVWIGMWLKKWKERFSLLIGQTIQKQTCSGNEAVAEANSFWAKLDCREELVEMVVSALIRNSEVCGTRIIAEDILKQEMRKMVNQDVSDKQQLLTVLNNALYRAREVSQRIGPLVSIKVEKNYYSEVTN
jgi:hypothetical protein